MNMNFTKMIYTEENIIGLKLRHKDYKIGDPMGQYTVGYNLDGSTLGLWFKTNNSSDAKLFFAEYTLVQITHNIEKGSWIPTGSEIINNYNLY